MNLFNFRTAASLIFFLFLVIIPLVCITDISYHTPSSNYRQAVIQIKADTLVYLLSDSNLVSNSETVISDSLLLVKDVDYQINYQTGSITFNAFDKLAQSVVITYLLTPDFLKQKMFLYEIQDIKDSLAVFTNIRKKSFVSDDDSELLISGSKTFSISFSNQQSYDLKQSLYLTLTGELGNNMLIEGKLSDSQSPLTPEGDSREISSLDQIYLKLYGKQYSVTLGDQDYEFTNTELMKYKTRFEGVNLLYSGNLGIQGALAFDGGKQKTNIIQGIDGKQGPYYLNAGSNSQNVLVVAGSEKVSINGVLLNRGTDYSIDYSEGSLMFKILITSNSRIIVDFQYSDDYYRQNLYLTSSYIKLSPNISINQHLIKQTDDKNNPLQWSFSKEDIDSLKKSGDSNVWGQGVIEVEPGSGQYIKMLDSNNYTYYEYALNDSTANYLIYFSYVGIGLGDYEPIGSNKYQYVGQGLGSWMPYKRLVAPVDKTNLGINVNFHNDLLDINSEGLFTAVDNNTFSVKDDSNNQGFISYNNVSFHPENYLYDPTFSLSFQKRTANTFTFSNLRSEIESYEFLSIPQKDSVSQYQYDLSLKLNNKDIWNQFLLFRHKSVMNEYNQNTLKNDTGISQIGLIPSIKLYSIYSNFTFIDSVLTSTDKHYHNLESGWKWKSLTLKSRLFLQKDDYAYKKADSLSRINKVLYRLINPQIKLSDNNIYSSSLSYTEELNSQKIIEWEKLNNSYTWQYDQLYNKNNNSLSFSFVHREIKREAADSLVSKNQKVDLLDVKSSHQLWDNTLSLITSYQINQLEFYPKIRDLQYVGNGLGVYDSTGVQVEDGDYDYVYINSGLSRLSSEINANLNFNYHLSKKYKPNSLWHRFNVESFLQLTENAPRNNNPKFYLLFPDVIYKSGTTIYGRQLLQESIWLDIWRNVLTGNLRYEINKILDDRYQALSKVFIENKEIELKWKNILGNQINNTYKNSYEKDTRYNSEIRNNEFSSVFFRNFSPTINSQLSLEYSSEKGYSSSQGTDYSISSIKVNSTLTWYLKNKYRFTSNFYTQYNKRDGSDLFSFLPDKRDGTIFLWSLRSQYRINRFTSGSFEYSGKSYPKDDILHEFKMEFRAEL